MPGGNSSGGRLVAPVYLMQLIEAVKRAGLAAEALFQGLGLVADDLDVPRFAVLPKEANTVVRRALRLLDAPELGLALGMHTRITQRGVLALGLMSAPTLGDAIALALQFPGSAGYLLSVHEEWGGHSHRLVAEPTPDNEDIAPFLVDIMFAGSVHMRRYVSDKHYAPMLVELVRPRPDNAAAHEKHYACPVHFGCSRNVLTTAAAGLAVPLPMANLMSFRLSQQLLEREYTLAGPRSALGLAVERAIRRALPLALAPVDLASSLNVSERSLRRKLAQEGLSYRGLLDEARRTRAFELMAGGRRSITDIAMQTGFSDVRAFSRAFRRWTGKPPSALQSAAQLSDGAGGDGGV